MSDFDGRTYKATKDGPRLDGQLERVFWTPCDGQWHTLEEISRLHHDQYYVRDTEAAISARIRDFRKEKFGNHDVRSRRRSRGQWEYRLVT